MAQLAGAGYGSAKGLDQIIEERILRQKLEAEIRQRDEALQEATRSRVASEGLRGKEIDVQQQNLEENRKFRQQTADLSQGEEAFKSSDYRQPISLDTAGQILKNPIYSAKLKIRQTLPESMGQGPLQDPEIQREMLPSEVQQENVNQRLMEGQQNVITDRATDNERAAEAAKNAQSNSDRQYNELVRFHNLSNENTRSAAQDKNAPIDVTGSVRTTLSGKKYLDLGDYATPTERDKARNAALAAGVLPVSKEVGMSLSAADTAVQNTRAMWAQIESKLPKDAAGRVLAGPGNKLQQFFQTDADLAAFNSWRAGAIQAVQALVERGMGFRLNQAEINMIMQNDMPQITDDYPTAKRRVQNVLTLLANKERSALTQDRSTIGASPEPSVEAGGMPAPQQKPIPGIPGGVAELRDGKWIRIK